MNAERFFDSYGGLWQVATGYERNVELAAFGPRGVAFKIPGHWNQFQPEEREQGEDGWWYLKDSARPRVFRCYNTDGMFQGYAVTHTAEQALEFHGLTEGAAEESPLACPVWGGRCEKTCGHCCGPDSNAWELADRQLSQGCGYNR